ncbi:hypothetical protein [Humidisolicoccus flavus]|uniref:hypothetical protein n=1 Tax=Humidisolicoccus flavus TaxID=3111414 RepID=UPI00324B1281
MNRRAVIGAGLTVIFALSACSALGDDPSGSIAPEATSSSSNSAAPFALSAGDTQFDPADDVAGVEACDGRSARTVLEEFDRAASEDPSVAGGETMLQCGYPDSQGWLHIADGHTEDFAEIADALDVGWEDVAWFAIQTALEQPTQVEMYREDIANYDILIELVDTSDGDLVNSWMVTVGVGLETNRIITSFPDEQ